MNLPTPNIILVSLDTTRADHLGCYGYRRLTSPHLDRFARQGVLFQDCFSTHIPTHPAHTCMMTGLDPFSTGVIAQGAQVEPHPTVRMLAEILQERGYFTAAADNLGRWFSRGFTLYEGYRWETAPAEPWRKAEAVNLTALKVLEECAAQQPFFAFLHYWDPHTPYLPPPPFSRMFYRGDEKDPSNPSMDKVWDFEPFSHYFAGWMSGVTDIQFPIAQYDASIAYLDSCLAHLFTRLDHLDLSSNTCMIITADHGEEMDEHECWFDHHGLYDTNLHVPLLLRWPAQVPAGQRIPGFVRTFDIAPTILDLAGIHDLDLLQGLQGESFLPLLHSPQSQHALLSPPTHPSTPTPTHPHTHPPTLLPTLSTPDQEEQSSTGRGVCSELYFTECTWMRKRAYRNHRYKYIQALEPDLHGKPPEELYDLLVDPAEKVNLVEARPQVAAQLKERLLSWQAEREQASGRPDPLESQSISLRQVGSPETPVPRRGS